MPNRLLRDWTDSLRLADISAEAERLFTRIIMKADDYGRFHADPRLLISACFPYDQQMTPSIMGKWLRELENKGLVIVYEVGPRKFLAVVSFGQRLRDAKSKFPSPPEVAADWTPTFDHDSDPAATRRTSPQPAASRGDVRGESPQISASVGDGDGDGVVCGDGDGKEREREKGVAEVDQENGAVPPVIPPLAKEKFMELAGMRGVPPDCAEYWWNEWDGSNWQDKDTGRVIANPIPKLINRSKNWKANAAQARIRARNAEASGGGSGENGREKTAANPPSGLTPEQLESNSKKTLARMLDQ